MPRIMDFLKTTLIGGLLFLVPLILLGLVLRHAMGVGSAESLKAVDLTPPGAQ